MLDTKIDQNLGKSYPPDLQIQVQTLENLDLKKNGLNSAKDILQYPLATGGGGVDSQIRAFPSLILPTDTIRISHSGGGESNVTLLIHDIPQQLPLAMVFITQLLDMSRLNQIRNLTPRVISHILEHLCSMLSKYSAPVSYTHLTLPTTPYV